MTQHQSAQPRELVSCIQPRLAPLLGSASLQTISWRLGGVWQSGDALPTSNNTNLLFEALEAGANEHLRQNRGVAHASPKSHWIRGDEIARHFFRIWYRNYTFIFRANIHITNIQYRELLSLVKLHSLKIGEEPGNIGDHILFDTSDHMKIVFISLWDSVLVAVDADTPVEEWISKKCKIICELYSSLLLDTILVDAYEGSCQIIFPCVYSVPLKQICGESGYIYSCGATIYMRRSSKVSVNWLRRNLVEYLKREPPASGTRIPFIIFSREQFPSSHSSDVRRAERNGLEDLKFHLDKFFFSDTPVSDLWRDVIASPAPEDIEISDADVELLNQTLFHRRQRHDPDARQAGTEMAGTNRSVWVVVERPARQTEPTTPSSRYFLCYVQAYTNRTAVFEVDETMPGWTAPATIPHTLSAAMLNVARAALHANRKSFGRIRVLDLFCGVGTTAIEAIKFSNVSKFVGVDIYKLNKWAAADNLHYLSLSSRTRQRFVNDISGKVMMEIDPHVARALTEPDLLTGPLVTKFSNFEMLCGGDWAAEMAKDPNDLKTADSQFRWAYAIASREFEEAKHIHLADSGTFKAYRASVSHRVSEGVLDRLQPPRCSWHLRILFYLCWKAFLSNIYELWTAPHSDSAGVIPYHKKKGMMVLRELGKFVARTRRIDFIETSTQIELSNSRQGASVRVLRGLYSSKTTITYKNPKRFIYKVGDIRDLNWNADEKFDIIITDPPYWFNVEDPASIREGPQLYNHMIGTMLKLISDGGQVIFCVPSKPMNGQRVPFYMTGPFVVKQFMWMAREANKRLTTPVENLPDPEILFRAPNYWESARALRRAIVHFQVFDKRRS